MLYEFYYEELEKQKIKKQNERNNNSASVGVQALFYISGLKPSSEGTGDVESFSSTICRDDQVDAVKQKFKTISSVHIYAVQLLELENKNVIDKLTAAFQEASILTDQDGRSAVE